MPSPELQYVNRAYMAGCSQDKAARELIGPEAESIRPKYWALAADSHGKALSALLATDPGNRTYAGEIAYHYLNAVNQIRGLDDYQREMWHHSQGNSIEQASQVVSAVLKTIKESVYRGGKRLGPKDHPAHFLYGREKHWPKSITVTPSYRTQYFDHLEEAAKIAQQLPYMRTRKGTVQSQVEAAA